MDPFVCDVEKKALETMRVTGSITRRQYVQLLQEIESIDVDTSEEEQRRRKTEEDQEREKAGGRSSASARASRTRARSHSLPNAKSPTYAVALVAPSMMAR